MAASIRRIRSVLIDDWDPVGVRDIPEAADEYDSYVMPIYSILRQRRSEDTLVNYLVQMSEHILGVALARDDLRSIAAKLLEIDLSRDERHE